MTSYRRCSKEGSRDKDGDDRLHWNGKDQKSEKKSRRDEYAIEREMAGYLCEFFVLEMVKAYLKSPSFVVEMRHHKTFCLLVCLLPFWATTDLQFSYHYSYTLFLILTLYSYLLRGGLGGGVLLLLSLSLPPPPPPPPPTPTPSLYSASKSNRGDLVMGGIGGSSS